MKTVFPIKKALTIALCTQMALGSLMMANAFTDTNAHWAGSAIQSLSNQNVIGGYPDGSFRPEANVTRAEFSAMLTKALGLQPAYGTNFNDVPAGHWAAPSIGAVRNQGLINGYPGNVFMPNRNISRAEALLVVANAAHAATLSQQQVDSVLSNYSDSNQVPTWARPAVAAAIQSGVFVNEPGSGNRIDPMRTASRAEIAVMLNNLRERSNMATNTSTNTGNAYNNNNSYNNNETSYNNTNSSGTTLQGYVMTVPAETQFTAKLDERVHSEYNRVGDEIHLTMSAPLLSSNGQVVVPAGSKVVGKLVAVEASGRLNKDARMDIDFNEIILPNGERMPIYGSVATEDGTLRASSTKNRALKAAGTTALGAGLGAALGTAMGPLSGGSVGRGAIYGTAIGAGAGAVAAAADKGKELVLEPGSDLTIRLQRPITVNPNQ